MTGGVLTNGSASSFSATGLDGRLVGGRDLHAGRFDTPNLPGVFGDGAVAGEFTGTSNVLDDHLSPFFRVLE